MDALFDTYQIAVHPTNGIIVQTKGSTAAAVLSIPAATVTANTTQALPEIIVPSGGNGGGSSTPASTPTVNAAPVANAGTSQSVVVGAVVTLDGNASSDANGDLLTYNWIFTSKPTGSGATLSSTSAVRPTFTADVAGTYVFNLIVNDGKVNGAASTVSVLSTPNNGSISVVW
jgi:hypothetical protein